jgi:hypothetical protein
MRKIQAALLLGAAALFIAGCGGNDDNGPQMKLAVRDAPVDGADHVVVSFTGVELTGDSGAPVEIDFPAPKSIDLITDSGTASAVLFDQPVPAGHYGQIRLKLQEPIPDHSFMHTTDGTTHPLNVPSGSETGLKLVSGFDVPGSGVVDYTIDFDLRQAITCPPGQAPNCTLKPAMRLVEDNSVGNIAGTIDASLTSPQGCSPAVYLYTGNATPEDYNSTAQSGDPNQPIASKLPDTSANPITYQFTFLAPGTYTVAYTCQGANDNPDQADSIEFTPVVQNITVTAGQTTTVNLPPAGP